MQHLGPHGVVEFVQVFGHAVNFLVGKQPLGQPGELERFVQVVFVHRLGDFAAELLPQQPWFQGLELIDGIVQLSQRSAQPGVFRRRNQMVHQQGVGTAARKRGFAQVVGNPQVDHGQPAQADVAPIVFAQPGFFARKQLHRAVRAPVNYRVGLPLVLQVPVEGQVVVGRGHVARVKQPLVLSFAP